MSPEFGDDEVQSNSQQRWILLALVLVVAVVVAVGVLGRSSKKHPASAPTPTVPAAVTQSEAQQVVPAASELVAGQTSTSGAGPKHFYYEMDVVNRGQAPLRLGSPITISGADQKPVKPVFVGVYSDAVAKRFTSEFSDSAAQPGEPVTILYPGHVYGLIFEIAPDCASPDKFAPWREGQPVITVPVVDGPDATFALDPAFNDLSGLVVTVCNDQSGTS